MAYLKSGVPLHCVEKVTGQNVTGIAYFSDTEMRVNFFSYDGFFILDASAPIYLKTQSGHSVSIHNNFSPGIGRAYAQGMTVESQEILCNIVVAGYNDWTENDLVKRVSFSVKHSDPMFSNNGKMEKIYKQKMPARKHFELFEVSCNLLKLSASYSATYVMGPNTPTKVWPRFEIEFKNPLNIQDYLGAVSNFVRFISFCIGSPLKPEDIKISRSSRKQFQRELKKETYPSDHEVSYVWPNENIDERDLWIGGSIVTSFDETELQATQLCLIAWIDRADRWENSYVMITNCLRNRGVISNARMLDAHRWFEEIPTSFSQEAISDEDIELISLAGSERAKQLGHAVDLQGRIKGKLKEIKSETAKQRFSRLLGTIKAKFGNEILPTNIIDHLMKARTLRGKCAHGHYTPANEAEYRAYVKSIHALEAFCYLLIAVDLPISPEGLIRIRSNPLVRDYLHSYE